MMTKERVLKESFGVHRSFDDNYLIRTSVINIKHFFFSFSVVPIKLYPVDSESECVRRPITIYTSLTNTLAEFRNELYELDEFRHHRSSIMLLILEMKCNAEKFLEDETISLRTTGLTPNSRVSTTRF